MNDKITKYLNKIKAEKKKQKQAAAFITAMSLVVSGTVSWQLHGIGTAMNNGDRSEKADAGTEQLSAASPLCENPQIWEEGLPDITENDLRESVALVAESQIGYKENTDNFIPDEDGKSLKYYTRYGDWYGNPYGEWNTMFTYFCMKYGGVDENDIPFGSGCWAWSVDLQKEELLITMDRGSPQRGDVLLLDSDMDGRADRSGIVSELVNEGDSQIIKVIEGNVSGTVAVQEYPIDDEHIIGYLALETEADNEAESVSSPAEQSEAETPPPTVVEFSGVSGSGIEVMASADVGAFPDGTVMTVSDIDREEALKAAKDSFDSEMFDAVAVDISFSDKDGNEIEPCADTTVQVQIILPDELKLNDGEFSLLHIADSGDVQKVENADVSETGAEFVAEEFSIYVVTSQGEKTPDQMIEINGQTVPNSSDNRYIMALGETIRIVGYTSVNPSTGNGYLWGTDGNILKKSNQNESSEPINTNTWKRQADYTAIAFGDTQINIDGGDEYGSHKSFYVRVSKPAIYVKTAIGEVEKDHVHAYLVDANGDSEEILNQCIYDNDNKPVYIKNSSTDAGKYVVYQGDTIVLVSYIPEAQQANSNGKYYSYSGSVTNINESNELLDNGIRKVTATIDVGNTGNGTVSIAGESFYIWSRSLNDTHTFNHSDIEIADGGQYTIENIIEYPDGKQVKTITAYDAYVSGVNECIIYGRNGETLNIHDNATNKDYSSYTTADYWFDPNFKPGDSQYEYTSAYNKSDGTTKYSSKVFWSKDAYSALFDISLNLRPATEQVITIQNGEIISNETVDISDREEVNVTSAIFELDHRSVIDALNKCPNHGGLDFTLQANLNSLIKAISIPINAKKELINSENNLPADGQFEFELLSGNEVIATVTNDADGNITFPQQVFMKEGEYRYTIREKDVSDDTTITYDNSIHDVVIKVSKDNNGDLSAIVTYDNTEDIPTFTNIVNTYELPATGGTGVIPYAVTGITIITGAAMLLIRSRRKEEN